MSDQHHTKRPNRAEGDDYATQMARAEFGRHYVDPERIEQTLKDGEIVFRHKPGDRRERRR
ncbi:MAG: hypothetical protein ABIO39_09820 [Caulobacteraceae bacterium]